MKIMDKLLFITGTRADYGKLKSLIKKSEEFFDVYVFVCGMHLLEEYGNTYRDIIDDGYKNIYIAEDITLQMQMDLDLANTIISLNKYITQVKPELIVVHGDRVDALAGCISGMLNNILIAHIEGGEVTGTVDEAIRHAISKMAHYHFTSNFESKLRILQLGEKAENIYTIGSPDIDIMLSALPDISQVKNKLNITFDDYAIFIYHPVTTEYDTISTKADIIFDALIKSNRNYIVIYPNNDLGSLYIIDKIKRLEGNDKFLAFKSIVFEEFLCLLKNASFIIGNSSAGVREACVYGIPAIDIGTRQSGRYNPKLLGNIQSVGENEQKILRCIDNAANFKFTSNYFGEGNSAELFIEALLNGSDIMLQKKFVDSNQTQNAIETYINEVCF